MLPCETIIGFMENLRESFQNEQDEIAVADTNEIQAHDEEGDYGSDSDNESDSDSDSDNESLQ